MEAKSFCYWLKGAIELGQLKSFNEEQFKILDAHLDMVFEHDIDPKMGSKEHIAALKDMHDKGKTQKDFDPNRRLMC